MLSMNSLNSVSAFLQKSLFERTTSSVKRQRGYDKASKTQVTEKIFKLPYILASVIYQFLEFTEFPLHLGKTPLLSFILLPVIALLVVQSSIRTLFTMVFCSKIPQQCLFQSNPFANREAIFSDNC